MLGAYLVLFPRARIQSLVFLGFFYQLIDVPAVLVLGFWFVLQVIDGLGSLGATDEVASKSRSSPTSAVSSRGVARRAPRPRSAAPAGRAAARPGRVPEVRRRVG